ncbi:acyltransferase [Pseudokineococcus sp. 5B2Z-1]|uniref:acyltransferase n=1 Tax=Pseudokineococcus sp. 5B2Z-1 TaxID=3132744 RepID=UPI0030AF2499
MTAGRDVPTPQEGRTPRQRAHDAERKLRYYAALARRPALSGRPMSFGPRVDVRIGPGGRLDRGERCVVAGDFHGVIDAPTTWGDDVFFNVGAYVCVFEGLTIGSRVMFGERVSIHDEDHVVGPVAPGAPRYRTSPVSIGDDVWVGANAVVLRGSRIGSGSVVAAGAVVRGEVPGGVLVAGVPAKVVREIR